MPTTYRTYKQCDDSQFNVYDDIVDNDYDGNGMCTLADEWSPSVSLSVQLQQRSSVFFLLHSGVVDDAGNGTGW